LKKNGGLQHDVSSGSSHLKIKDLGEFQLIERIRQQVPVGEGVQLGIGDDAAAVTLPEGHHLLTSTDMLIEGVHFRHDWIAPEDLGHKAVAVNLSDIAAMGGTPRYLYLGFACPGTTALDDLNAFLQGALDEAGRYGVTLVGGDTCRSPGPWIIAVTVEGSTQAGHAIGRDGAQPGDLIMVSGTVGDSAMALHLLQNGNQPDARLLKRHHRPTPRIELGRLLAKNRTARAMIDISDGLAADLEHILQASRVGALIEDKNLPVSAAFKHQADKQPSLRDLALFGGEDYELLFTLAPENEAEALALGAGLNLPVTRIGVIQDGPATVSLDDGKGAVRPILVRGYDHFCRL
jgi:thiamine-monophosphate kinase